MPDVLIETQSGWILDRKRDLLEAVQAALVESLHIPPGDKMLRLVEHQAGCYETYEGTSDRYVRLEIVMFRGRSDDAKRDLYRSIVAKLEPFGVPRDEIKVVLIEVEPIDVGFRGGQAAADVALGYSVEI